MEIEEIIILPRKEEEESIQALALQKKMLYLKHTMQVVSLSLKRNLPQKRNNLNLNLRRKKLQYQRELQQQVTDPQHKLVTEVQKKLKKSKK